MAAYAALVSLSNTLNNIQNHPRLSTSLDKNQIQSLVEKLDFLLEFMESDNSHGGTRKEVEDLESLIASEAFAAEDVIECHVVDQILAGSSKESSVSVLDLKKEVEELDSLVVKITEVKEEWRFKEKQIVYSKPANSSRPLTSVETPMVGFEGYLVELLEALTRNQPDRQIIPISGMGGIGKTTLARCAFEHPVIIQHFDVRAWVNVSQKYNLRQISLEILSSLEESTSKLDERTQHELGKLLYKKLFGRRYLIVLDDMWENEAWDNIEFFFPDNYNGSRIIVTTRLFKLANHFGSSGLVVDLLDENQSWALFHNTVFAEEEGCPPELEKIGKTIVRQCKGLPLSINVIGGLLRKSSRRLEFWESIAENISTILASEEDNLMDILSLSYTHLPAHLKPCFLYMGVFQEDQEIRVSMLTKLWVAEGFIKLSSHKNLEDVAEDYLKNLVDRNLVLAHSLRSNGKLKTCKMHDLLRALCTRVVEKEKFLSVNGVFDTPQDKNWERQIINQGSTAVNPQLFHTLESTPLARTLICDSRAMMSYKSKLRVLTEVHGDSLNTTFQQVNLRFLACKSIGAPVGWINTYKLPSSISLLWNMQTLIIDESIDKVVAPPEIWEMPELRHLQFHELSLSDPPPRDDQDDIVLLNLQTLEKVLDFRFSEEACRRIPNIKKLSISYDDFSGEGEKSSWYDLYNVGNFESLETLKLSFYTVPERNDLLSKFNFPRSLKKLRLEDCELHWSDLSKIDSLPHLEVLKLKHQSARGPKWNTVEGHFPSLKFLEIESCYLIHWNADYSSFPCLEKLVLSRLYKLVEIPPSLGDIPTLESICVVDCSISAAISAVKMLEEQQELGNDDLKVRVSFSEKEKLEEEGIRKIDDLQVRVGVSEKMKLEEEQSRRIDDLQVRVGFSEKMKLEEFRERVEIEGFRSNNLHMDGL